MESEWQTIKRELISSFLKSRFIMVDFHLKILKKWEEKKMFNEIFLIMDQVSTARPFKIDTYHSYLLVTNLFVI